MAQQVTVSLQIGTSKIEHFKSIQIIQSLNTHHTFQIVVPFESLEEKSQFFFRGAHEALIGKAATISFKPKYKKVPADFKFLGVVTELSLSNNSETINSYVIKGHSPTVLMEDGQQRRAWVASKLGGIFGTVANDYAGNLLKFNIAPNFQNIIDYKTQYDETNWAFTTRLAHEYGEWCYYDGQTLNIGKPSTAKQEFVIDGVQHFDMAISIKPSKFQMHHYNYQVHKSFDAAHSPGSGYGSLGDFAYEKSNTIFSNPAQLIPLKDVGSPGELDGHRKTLNLSNGSDLVRFKGHGENPNLTVGMIVSVIGQRLIETGKFVQESIGEYRLVGISHFVDGVGNYENHFEALPASADRPPHNSFIRQPASMPEVATVFANEDPKKLGRVKVQFHWPNRLSGKSSWIRVAMPYTGGAKGSLSIPEIEDQVLISYEANHVDFPVVVGSLYHKDPSTDYWSANNYMKVMRTKGGNKLTFQDNPNSQEIYITNSNKKGTNLHISFKGDGTITLQTAGLIKLEAKDIKMQAKNNIEMQAGNNVTIKGGTNVTIKAGSNAEVSASTTDIKGSIVNVKGSMVKIN